MYELYGYEQVILKGAILTLEVAVLSLLLAITFGILGALSKLSSIRTLRMLAGAYTTIIRGVPDLILMLLIYYGGQVLLNNFLYSINEWLNAYMSEGQAEYEFQELIPSYIEISPFIAGVLTIGFIFGAYMTETFRGAILSIKQGEIQAAKAFGMRYYKVVTRIIFPQMLRYSISGITNNWLVLLKTTALVSLIGLEDVVRVAALASGSTREPFTFYLIASLVFLFFTSVSTMILKRIEKHLNRSVRRG